MQRKRQQLLGKLPPANITSDQDQMISKSIDLSNKNERGEYFVSNKLKSAKEKPDQEVFKSFILASRSQ